MNLFEVVKASINTQEAAQTYGIDVNHYGMSLLFSVFYFSALTGREMDRKTGGAGLVRTGAVIDPGPGITLSTGPILDTTYLLDEPSSNLDMTSIQELKRARCKMKP